MSTGIYAVTNTITKRVYIGQAQNIKRRLREHRYKLRAGVHHNAYLQASWNKHGESVFVFDIVERCHPEELTMREIEWTSLFRPGGLYNIASIEAPMLGRRHTPEAIAKMKLPRSKETADRISKALIGKKHSPEHAEKTGASKKKAVFIVSTGVRYASIKEAAKAVGVHTVNLSAHLKGRSKTCKGLIWAFAKKEEINLNGYE